MILTRFVVLYVALALVQSLHRVGIGAPTALLTFLSGFLYMRWGADGFWFTGCAVRPPRCR